MVDSGLEVIGIENPQEKCPREGMNTGEGYHLCKEIFKQQAYAEVDVCRQVGGETRSGMLYLIGHFIS